MSSDYSQANHQPQVEVLEGNQLFVKAGDNIELHAKASDPDGDDLTYRWWEYSEAGTYNNYKIDKDYVVEKYAGEYKIGSYLKNQSYIASQVELDVAEDGQSVRVVIPQDAKSGDTIHIIVSVTDNGKHTLTSHQRVILVVE